MEWIYFLTLLFSFNFYFSFSIFHSLFLKFFKIQHLFICISLQTFPFATFLSVLFFLFFLRFSFLFLKLSSLSFLQLFCFFSIFFFERKKKRKWEEVYYFFSLSFSTPPSTSPKVTRCFRLPAVMDCW